jgi:hypothetical protein
MTSSLRAGDAAPAPPVRSAVRTARSRLDAPASGVVATAPRGGLPGGRDTFAWAWGPSFRTLTCLTLTSRVNDPSPVQGLDDLQERSDRIHAEDRVGLTPFRRRTVGIRPRPRQLHGEPAHRADDQMLRTGVENVEGLALKRVMPTRDRHSRRRRRSAVIVPIV